MLQTKSIFALVLVLFIISGCAKTLVGGKRNAKILPGKIIGIYKIPKCKSVPDGSVIPGFENQIFKIIETENGPILYEMSAAGGVASLTNNWQDENGMNFVFYLKGGHAYHSIIPEDKSKSAELIVYKQKTYDVKKFDEILKITKGNPFAKCEMILDMSHKFLRVPAP